MGPLTGSTTLEGNTLSPSRTRIYAFTSKAKPPTPHTPHTTNTPKRDRVPLGIINDLQAPRRAQPSRLTQVADEADLAPSTASLFGVAIDTTINTDIPFLGNKIHGKAGTQHLL